MGEAVVKDHCWPSHPHFLTSSAPGTFSKQVVCRILGSGKQQKCSGIQTLLEAPACTSMVWCYFAPFYKGNFLLQNWVARLWSYFSYLREGVKFPFSWGAGGCYLLCTGYHNSHYWSHGSPMCQAAQGQSVKIVTQSFTQLPESKFH